METSADMVSGCAVDNLKLLLQSHARRRRGAVDVLKALSALDAPQSTARGLKAGRYTAEGLPRLRAILRQN